MRILTQIIFWFSVYVILLIGFGQLAGNYINSFYFVSFFLPVVIATSVIFNEVLVQKYLLRGLYYRFALYTFYLLVVSLNLEMILVFVSFTLMSYFDPENMGVLIGDFRLMPVVMYLIVFIYAFIGLVIRFTNTSGMALAGKTTEDEYIILRSNRKNRRVLCLTILYIESMADYVRVFTSDNEKIISRETISNLANNLPTGFLRIHRSYIINISHLVSFNKETVIIGDKSLPISRTYKKDVIETLNA